MGDQWRIPLLVALVALAIRSAFVVIQSFRPIIDAPFVAGDSLLYLELGQNIAEGRGMITSDGPTAFVGPGYPMFLAILLRSGTALLGIGLVQAILGALTAGLVAHAAARLARSSGEPQVRIAAWIGGGAAALYPHLVLWTGYVLSETLFLALMAGAIVAALHAASGSPRAAAVGGLAAGAAALTRSAYLAAAIVTLLWLIWAARRGRRTAVAVAFAFALIVPLAAWTTRNVLDMGAPVVTSTSGGASLYHGNARGGTGGTRGYADSVDIPPIDVPQQLDEVGRDAFYQRRAVADITSDPLGTVARYPSKLWNMWRPTYEGSSLRNIVTFVVSYPPVLIFGLIGAVRLARTSRIGVLPLALLSMWVVAHVVIVGIIRYRVPAELLLLMTFPTGMLWMTRTLRRR